MVKVKVKVKVKLKVKVQDKVKVKVKLKVKVQVKVMVKVKVKIKGNVEVKVKDKVKLKLRLTKFQFHNTSRLYGSARTKRTGWNCKRKRRKSAENTFWFCPRAQKRIQVKYNRLEVQVKDHAKLKVNGQFDVNCREDNLFKKCLINFSKWYWMLLVLTLTTVIIGVWLNSQSDASNRPTLWQWLLEIQQINK